MRGRPDLIPIGGCIKLVSVSSLADGVGISDQAAHNLLFSLQVPLITLEEGGEVYFNLPTLEFILLQLLRPSGKGYRNHKRAEPVVAELENYWRHHALREEMQFLTEHYGWLDQAQIKNRCTRIAKRLRSARLRMEKRMRPRAIEVPHLPDAPGNPFRKNPLRLRPKGRVSGLLAKNPPPPS